jgi:hypothetical protein
VREEVKEIKAEDGVTTTVRELIAALSKMPQDAKVETEGCDCYGAARTVGMMPDGVTVEIGR